jgi:hypothetical protein
MRRVIIITSAMLGQNHTVLSAIQTRAPSYLRHYLRPQVKMTSSRSLQLILLILNHIGTQDDAPQAHI